jgi:hypothetical protein
MITIQPISNSLKAWITPVAGLERRISTENEKPVFLGEATVGREVNALFCTANIRTDNGELWGSNGGGIPLLVKAVDSSQGVIITETGERLINGPFPRAVPPKE